MDEVERTYYMKGMLLRVCWHYVTSSIRLFRHVLSFVQVAFQ